MTTKAQLACARRVLRQGQDRMRDAVLVIGNGLHLEAAVRSGAKRADCWETILRRMWRELGTPGSRWDSLPPSTPIRWSALTRATAIRTGATLAAAELELKRRLCDEMRAFEEKERDRGLYGHILDGRFRHIISLGIDRRLARHARGEAFSQRGWMKRSYGYLERHSIVSHDDGSETRVWYPHGDTLDPKSLRLGVDDHIAALATLEDKRSYLMNDWRLGDSLKDPIDFFDWRKKQVASWYDLFFLAPLVFVGTRMSPDDWSLWWLLHQRARNLVPFEANRRPPAYALGATADQLDHLRDRPAQVELVEFDDYSSLWSFLIDAI